MRRFSRFQDLFDCEKPIIQAGMGPYDTTSLAAAVSRAGGLGLVSTVGMGTFQMPRLGDFRYSAIFGEGTPEELLNASLDRVLQGLKQTPQARFGINVPVSAEFIPTASRVIRALAARLREDPEAQRKCRVLVTSAGDPLPWALDPLDGRVKGTFPVKAEAPSLTWCHVVPSVRAAQRSEKAGVDVIVASGREGGAHCSWRDTSSLVLLPEVVKVVKKPVVGAGGFADGRSLVAALALGAVGIQMGTRFIATQESDFDQRWKEQLLSATEEDTLVARGFFGPMRFVRNRRALDLVDATLRGSPALYKGIPAASTPEIVDLEVGGLQNLYAGQIEDTPILGGVVAGRIHSIPRVDDLIQTIIQEALEVLEGFADGKGL